MIRLVIKCFGLAWKRVLKKKNLILPFSYHKYDYSDFTFMLIPAATFDCQSPGRINHPINTELMGGMLIRAVNIPPLSLSVLFQQLFIFSFVNTFFVLLITLPQGLFYPSSPCTDRNKREETLVYSRSYSYDYTCAQIQCSSSKWCFVRLLLRNKTLGNSEYNGYFL